MNKTLSSLKPAEFNVSYAKLNSNLSTINACEHYKLHARYMAFYTVSVPSKEHRDKLARVYFTTTSMTVTFNYGVIYHTPLTLRV